MLRAPQKIEREGLKPSRFRVYSEKFFCSLLVGRDSNPDDRISGMETRPTKPLFIV